MIALVIVALLCIVAAAVRDYGLGPTAIALAVTIPGCLAILALGFVLH
jgi:hypothetical protein